MFKNVKILESGDNIRYHRQKCIQMSTNMPGIGSVIREIAFEILRILIQQNNFAWYNQWPLAMCYC